MKTGFDKKHREVKKQLPGYKANPGSWAAIEQYLDFSEKLEKVKTTLPLYSPPDTVWQHIEEAQPVHVKQGSMLLLKVAAIAILLLGSLFVYRVIKPHNISYSVEFADIQESALFEAADSTLLEVTDFIDQQCRNHIYVCLEPDFTIKKQKLEEVNNEIENLEKVMKTYGSSESLVKTRVNLENYKAELIKDLIKKLTS